MSNIIGLYSHASSFSSTKKDGETESQFSIPSTVTHKATGIVMDNYGKPPSVLFCGKQERRGRKPTKVFHGGFWIPGPDNPGKYGRTYGDEILRHVLHVVSSKTAYANLIPKFQR